jgi:hypothetical protein
MSVFSMNFSQSIKVTIHFNLQQIIFQYNNFTKPSTLCSMNYINYYQHKSTHTFESLVCLNEEVILKS